MNYVPEPVDYDMYANMDYWKFDEATWLSVSYKLSQRMFDSKEEYSSGYDKEYSRLSNIINRSIDSGMIRGFHVIYDMEHDGLALFNMSYVTPYRFVEWVISKGYDLPSEFKGIKLGEFRITDIQDKIETEWKNKFIVAEYEIEDGENMSCLEIEDKIGGMDIRAGGVPQDGTPKPSSAVQNESDNKEVTRSSVKRAGSQQYRFEKAGKGWCLQYGDVRLLGVKDWMGMIYIKTLLMSPGTPISVLDLQRIAGSSNDVRDHVEVGEEEYDDGEDSASGGVDAWEDVDATAKSSYLGRLEVISVEIKVARSKEDQAKIDVLTKEAEFIQKELKAGSFRSKDPELDKNRKRVLKSITDAIKNIRKLEVACNYNDRPISNHLDRYIQTGSCCSYKIDSDMLPSWTF